MVELQLRTTGMEFASEMVVKSTLADLRVDEVPTTLRPDGRSRPPHLSTWKDGWRHLRFLLVYSPRWLFLYPGFVLGAIGFVGMVLLGTGLWKPGVGDFPTALLVASGGMVIVAFQAILFSMLAQDFAISEGLLPPRMTSELLRHRPVFEYALVAASVLLVAGLVGLVTSLVLSGSSDPMALDATPALRLGICSVVLCVVGLQCALGGAFMSVLRIKRIGAPAVVAATGEPAGELGS